MTTLVSSRCLALSHYSLLLSERPHVLGSKVEGHSVPSRPVMSCHVIVVVVFFTAPSLRVRVHRCPSRFPFAFPIRFTHPPPPTNSWHETLLSPSFSLLYCAGRERAACNTNKIFMGPRSHLCCDSWLYGFVARSVVLLLAAPSDQGALGLWRLVSDTEEGHGTSAHVPWSRVESSRGRRGDVEREAGRSDSSRRQNLGSK